MHVDLFEMERSKSPSFHEVDHDLPVESTELVDRIRTEKSVLLVPGDTVGLGRAIRFGHGCDIERTMGGLARLDEVLAAIAR